MVTSAVVLAAGRGTRMQAPGPEPLSPAQAAAAARGAKAMMPVGRPFLDHVLHALAEAGMRRIALVVGPDHAAIAHRYGVEVAPRRFALELVVQPEPAGTADAVLRAEPFAAGRPFLVVNGDNLYPAAALAALARVGGPALVGWEREALVAGGHIEPERIARYALIRVAPDGTLAAIVEKPDPAAREAFGPDALVSMNCWSFDAAIFAACRAVRPSSRGELELQDAVTWAMQAPGVVFRVVPWRGAVLDLTGRGDVAAVAARVRDWPVEL